jgi:hypothetical protein
VPSSSFQVPIRDGLTLIVRGWNGSASMSATPWIGAQRLVGGRERQVGILQPGLRERLGDPAVELGVGRDVDGRALVGALEVDRRDGAGGGELRQQPVVPGRRRVELEARAGIRREAPRHGLGARRLTEPQRDDEVDRPRLAPEQVGERAAGLAQREVGGGRLERPAAVLDEGGHAGIGAVEEVEAVEMARERVDRPAAGERQHRAGVLLGLLQLGRVDDVLAEALLTAALEVDRRGQAVDLELAGLDVAGASLEGVGVDQQRELGERVIQGHRLADSTVPAARQDVGP